MTEQSEPSTPPKPRLTQTARGQTIFVSLWVLGTLVTLGVWVGAFVLGQSVGAPEDVMVEEVVDVVEIAAEFPELGPPSQTPGTWAWDELRGGECLTGFSDPFAEEFQVVSCSSPHTAELLHAELLSRVASEPYPGDPAVLAAARAACDVRDLVNIEVAQEFSDLRTSYSYPVSADQWDAGERGVYCFVYSESGATFTSSLR
ncbi:MAG: septum formation family protein [Actinomycetota bacterium]|nr:septum formation family protein [Actinomycetota bacterium]